MMGYGRTAKRPRGAPATTTTLVVPGLGVGGARHGRKVKRPRIDWKHPSEVAAADDNTGGKKRRRRKPTKRARVVVEDIKVDFSGGAAASDMVDMQKAFEMVPETYRRVRAAPDQIIARQCPNILDALVGDQPVQALRDWAADLERGKKAILPRVLVVTGPSGTGKTTAARLLLKEAGYLIHEYSTADVVDTTKSASYPVLSERGIDEVIYPLLIRNQAFGKFALLLDDVSAGAGGAGLSKAERKALAEVVSGERYQRQFGKSLRHAPVVITCDATDLADLHHVVRHGHVVETVSPTVFELKDWMKHICQVEELTVADSVMDQVCVGCGGDVRRLLNTLHFLVLDDAMAREGGNVSSVVDVDTIFHNHTNPVATYQDVWQLVVVDGAPLDTLDDLIEPHPVSLCMLLHENYVYHLPQTPLADQDAPNVASCSLETLEAMANCAEHYSMCDGLMDSAFVHQESETKEAATVLLTWGAALMEKTGAAAEATSIAKGTVHKSDFFSWKERRKHRKRLMANMPHLIAHRGVNFVDVATVVREMIRRYKRTKTLDADMMDWFRHYRLSHVDVQDLWKAAHLHSAVTTMPNIRGNLSLIKALKEMSQDGGASRKRPT